MKQSSDATQSPDGDTIERNADDAFSFDRILGQIGAFGAYQISIGFATGFVLMFGSFTILNFVFTTMVPAHRCFMPECEQLDSSTFHAEWLKFAAPFRDNRPDPCGRFEAINRSSAGLNDATCSSTNFNRSRVLQCDRFIVENNEQRLMSHLNLLCSDEEQKLPLIAMASTLGRVLAMPGSGIISDKFGRLRTILTCSGLGAIFASAQALIPAPYMSFNLYLLLEFVASVSTTGIVGACFVYNMEWTTAEYRVRLNTMAVMTEICSPLFIGLAAWRFQHSFAAYRFILGVPGFLLLFLYFVFGESPQWLLVQGKYAQAISSIKNAGRINGRRLSDTIAQQIRQQHEQTAKVSRSAYAIEQAKQLSIVDLLKQKTLAFRLFILSLVWLFTFLAYFGILLNSTQMHENKYLSFILIGLAEIPSALLTILLLDRVGRRLTIGVAMLCYGLVLSAATVLSLGPGPAQLALFVVGKTAITTALFGLYTYSVELWPTAIRNTAFNICEMAGRSGTMLATICVLLDAYYVHFTAILYVSAAIFGAILLFVCLPETVHCKQLPDTMDEAIAIGRNGMECDENGES